MERPKRNAPEIVKAAAIEIARECHRWCNETSVEEYASDLEKVIGGRYDGYEIAKELDDRYYWMSIDFELVEILDGASSQIDHMHREAVKAWAAAIGWKPEFSVGETVVSDRHGEGVVSRIFEESAQYCFIPESEADNPKWKNGGGYVLDAERVSRRLAA